MLRPITLICQSHISKKLKRGKAHSIYPIIPATGIFNSATLGLDICGGEVTIEIEAGMEGNYGCNCQDSPELRVTFTCTRCQSPFIGNRFIPNIYQPESLISTLVMEALQAQPNHVEYKHV